MLKWHKAFNNEKHPAVRPIWSYRRVAVYGSSMHFIAGYPLTFLYAIFAWRGIELRGLMCLRNVGKPSVYQALSAFMEKYWNMNSVASSTIHNFIWIFHPFNKLWLFATGVDTGKAAFTGFAELMIEMNAGIVHGTAHHIIANVSWTGEEIA